MEVQEDDHMEIVNTGNRNGDAKLEDDTLQNSESQEKQDNTSIDMNIEDEITKEEDEEDDEEKTKEEDPSRIDGSDVETNDKEEEITKDEEIESDFYDSDLDLENLEGSDPAEIERKRQFLLEKRNKLIEFLASKGADPEELLQLGIEQAESMTPPSSTRQKRKRSKRLSESPSYSLRDSKSRKGKSVKKTTPKKETPETIPVYDDSKSSSDNKRERTTWTLSENRQLLKILESGQTDVQHIYKEMSKIPGRRKSLGHIRNKKSNLLQKAALKGTDMIDILREDISKSDETEVSTRSRRFQKEPEVYNEPLYNAVSTAEFSELKNLLISGLLENQRQIALLRRDFAHYRGLPTPPEVADILSDDEHDEITHDHLKSSNSGRKTLVIRKNKQKDVNNINLEEDEVVNK